MKTNNFEILLFYLTIDSKENAERISKHLINNKLVACTNIFPITSLYNFKDQFCNENEYAIILKTLNNFKDKVFKEIQENHVYDIPCIIQSSCFVNKKFYLWMHEQLGD